jgi:hypothetical protein
MTSSPVSEKVNLPNKFSQFTEHWRPKVVASLNGQEVKVVKVKGSFPWHHHDKEEEMFLVWKGKFRVEFKEDNGYVRGRWSDIISSFFLFVTYLTFIYFIFAGRASGRVGTRRNDCGSTWGRTQDWSR